jgi:hypothetical protein
MHTRADSGSGFLVGCAVPFNILGIVQSIAGDQVSPVQIIEYWNGSAWTALTAGLLIADTLIGGGTGEKVLCWPTPSDWAVGGTGTGVPADKYNIRVRHTTSGAGTANPAASQLFVGYAKMQVAEMPDKTSVALVRESEYLFPPQCDSLWPVFSTAGVGNTVEVDVRPY